MRRTNQRYDNPNQLPIPYEVIKELDKQRELLQKMMVEIRTLRLEVNLLKDILQGTQK